MGEMNRGNGRAQITLLKSPITSILCAGCCAGKSAGSVVERVHIL